MMKRLPNHRLVAGLLSIAWSLVPAGAEDWFRFRGPRLDGIARESIDVAAWPDTGPPALWRDNVGTGLSGVVISNGRLFTNGNEDNVDTVVCLDAATGKRIWSHAYPCATDANEFDGGPTSTPTVDPEASVVFTLSRRGDLFCFDASTGDVRWQIDVVESSDVRIPSWGFSGSPLLLGRRLLLNVGDAGVAVDASTGKLVWTSADKDAGYSSLVPIRLGEADAVVLGSSRSIVCVEASSGNEVWRERWLTTFGCNAADPIVNGSSVFVSSGYNRGAARWDVGSGQPVVVWQHKEMQNQLGTSVLIGEHLYGIHGDVDAGASLRCIRWSDGEVQWTTEGIRFGAMSATGDQLVTLTDDGELIIVSADPTRFVAQARTRVLDGRCWVAPVLTGGRIYLRNSDGDVACLDVNPQL